MWPSFFIACAVGALFLLCPGYLVLRLAFLSRGRALCAAPLFSSLLFSLLGIACEQLDIAASPLTVVAIPSAVLFASAIVIRFLGKTGEQNEESDIPLRTIVQYAVIGLIAGLAIFVKQLDGPLSFVQGWDVVHHLNGTQAFAESGVFSFFHGAVYTVEEAEIAPMGPGSFYPAGWQIVCALLTQAMHVPAALGINATNYLFSSLVFPLGMAFFLNCLFEGNEYLLRLGSFTSISFSAFPWLLTLWGPIYPNLAAYCVVPMVCALFIDGYREVPLSRRVRSLILFLLGMLGTALLQPNGVFVVAVMLGSFLIWEALEGRLQEKVGISSGSYYRDALLLIAIFALLWLLVNRAPFMRNVTDYVWERYQSPVQAVINFISLGYVDGFFEASSAQLLLAALIVYGVVRATRDKRSRWLIQAYLFWGVALVLTTSTDGIVKQLVAGFWYTDHCRLASAAVFCAIPLVTVGLEGVLTRIGEALETREPAISSKRLMTKAIVLYLLVVFFPSYHIPGYADVSTGFGRLCASIESAYRVGSGMLDIDEQAFLEQAAELIPEGAVVANNPLDGSVFAFGVYDIHVLYRNVSGYGESELESSKEIRNNLDEYRENGAVQDSVEELDVEYVLLLNVDSRESSYINYILGDGTDAWPSLYEIDEKTPGFTLILEEGDMRLYELDEAT